MQRVKYIDLVADKVSHRLCIPSRICVKSLFFPFLLDYNKAFGKPFYDMMGGIYKSITDGSRNGQWARKQFQPWVILDLEGTVKVAQLRLHNLKGDGSELNYCYALRGFDSDISMYIVLRPTVFWSKLQ